MTACCSIKKIKTDRQNSDLIGIIFFRVTCMKHAWHPKMQFDSVNLAGLKNVYS